MMLSTINALRRRQPGLIAQLRRRLVFCVSVLVFCLLLSLGIGIYVSFNQQQIGAQKVLLHDNVNMLIQAMVDQETGLRGYITTNNATFLAPLNDGQVRYTSSLQLLKNETDSPDFLSTASELSRVDNRATIWVNTFANVQIANMQAGKFTLARSDQTNAEGKALFDDLREAVTLLQHTSDADLGTLQTRTTIIDMTALGGVLLLTALVVLWLWLTFVYFTRNLRKQLDILQETTTSFGEGDLDARVERVTDTDLNDLAETFNTMAATLQSQQKVMNDRDILEQVSQLNTLLTDSLDLNKLMDNFLKRTLALLDAQVGALYLYDAQQQQLKLFATRGLRPEEMPETFALGEGLVGRAALDRMPMLLSPKEQVEDTTFRVKTIAGSVLPASLFDLPLVRGTELLGVLAIGSVYPMGELARNVLQVVASNVAAAISNTLAYDHIQQQTEELTARAREQEHANRALRQQRDELTVLNGALEEANRARSQFLSTMSHELRTPLTSIIGFSQMLLRSKAALNERQHNNVERILKNAQHLLTLINNVLDLAKVEAGRMDVNTSEVNLKELLASLVDETRSQADERKLKLSLEVQDTVPPLETDPLKVRQIILNLLSNAIKFTEKGGVTISAELASASQRNQLVPGSVDIPLEQVAISIKDTGIGIAPDMQERIFEAFYQVDNSNSRNYGGTGLGLSIVRELTALLGGKIELQSQQGQGTTFTVFLPIHVRDRHFVQNTRLHTFARRSDSLQRALAQVKQERAPEQAEEQPYLVVAIDDNPDVLNLISSSLEQSPYRVIGVQDATQAVTIVQELQPNAVTLDIMMPRINGWQILHELKSNPATASIPVILLTVLEDRSAGYVLGADEYLVKPVARDDLLNTLKGFTSQPLPHTTRRLRQNGDGEAQNQPAPGVHGEEKVKHILLVHHEPNILPLVEQLVNESGYEVKMVDSGADVMTVIQERPPDLVMMFVKMDEQRHIAEQSE